MSEYTEQITRELLALSDDATGLRRLLAEAWQLGYDAGDDDLKFPHARVPPVNPFTSRG